MKPRGNILMCNECGFKIRTSASKRTCLKCGGDMIQYKSKEVKNEK